MTTAVGISSFSLEKTVELLEAAAKAAGVAVKAVALGQRTDDRDTLELVKNIVTGAELHPSLTPLAMRLAVQNVPKDVTTALLQGMMYGAGSATDVRWAARYGEIPGIVGSAYAKLDFAPTGDWMDDLTRGARGVILNSWRNIWLAFSRSTAFTKGTLRLNMRERALEVHGDLPWEAQKTIPRPWSDDDAVQGAVWLGGLGFPKINPNEVHKAAGTIGSKHGYDPLADYLTGLQWDGVPRIDTWLERYCGAVARDAETRQYVSGVGRRWLIQAVARAMRPGCQADNVLILEGPQGIRKSTALQILGGEWFAEHLGMIKHGDKDALMALAKPWIIELPELSALRKAEVESIKAFITTRVDHYRTPWDRLPQAHPRGMVFAGTTNRDGAAYLQDTTGNRRFWPVELKGQIDTENLALVRDELWAEATMYFKRGDRWFIDQKELSDAAEKQVARRSVQVSDDAWYGPIDLWLETNPGDWTCADIVAGSLHLSRRDINNPMLKRAATILANMGFEPKHTKKGNVWAKVKGGEG